MNQQRKLGFTLVELIVVITIVGILSTVGFVSYSGYLSGARDSNRMSQLTKISDSLQVYAATKSLPLPDNYVEIQASGSTIAYQGEVGVDVLETIDYTNGGTDPKDDSYYTYYLTKDRKSIQLMALMEEQSTVAGIPSTYAADYTDRFPKVYGRKLGTLTQVDTNTPIQQLSQYQSTPFDVVTETSQFIAHISDDEKLEGTGSTLQASIHNGSCKRIKQTGQSRGTDTYIINPAGTSDLTVYCDMETAGGGWTLVARTFSGSTATNFGWLYNFGSIDDDNEAYSMGVRSQNVSFSSILFGSYTTGKNIDLAVKFDVDDRLLKNSPTSGIATSNCSDVVGNTYDGTESACQGSQYVGHINNTLNYFIRSVSSTNTLSGLRENGIYQNAKGTMENREGMILVK